MGQKVCLDSDIAIEIVKNKERGLQISEELAGIDVHLTVVGLFELLMRKTNLEAVEEFVKRTTLLGFDEKAARKASEIDKELKKNGTPVAFRDVFIAATALVNECALATLNIKDFSRIKGLKLLKLH